MQYLYSTKLTVGRLHSTLFQSAHTLEPVIIGRNNTTSDDQHLQGFKLHMLILSCSARFVNAHLSPNTRVALYKGCPNTRVALSMQQWIIYAGVCVMCCYSFSHFGHLSIQSACSGFSRYRVDSYIIHILAVIVQPCSFEVQHQKLTCCKSSSYITMDLPRRAALSFASSHICSVCIRL